jgi:hypothetical protein
MATKIAPQVWSREEVWGAAAHANRVNGGYFKVPEFNEQNQKSRLTNKEIVQSALEDTSQIPLEDINTGRLAHNFISQRCMLRILKGKASEFDIAMARAVELENFTRGDAYEIALVSSQIESYIQGMKDVKLQELADRSLGHLGEEKDQVTATVEVHKVIWSEKYGTYYITGLTDTKQAVMFNHKQRLHERKIYTIRGRVKAKRTEFTQLNRVHITGVAEKQHSLDPETPETA